MKAANGMNGGRRTTVGSTMNPRPGRYGNVAGGGSGGGVGQRTVTSKEQQGQGRNMHPPPEIHVRKEVV